MPSKSKEIAFVSKRSVFRLISVSLLLTYDNHL